MAVPWVLSIIQDWKWCSKVNIVFWFQPWKDALSTHTMFFAFQVSGKTMTLHYIISFVKAVTASLCFCLLDDYRLLCQSIYIPFMWISKIFISVAIITISFLKVGPTLKRAIWPYLSLISTELLRIKHMTFCSVSEQHVVGYFLAGVTRVQMEQQRATPQEHSSSGHSIMHLK